jgi:hypothetical protein
VISGTLLKNVVHPSLAAGAIMLFQVPSDTVRASILLAALPSGFFGVLFGPALRHRLARCRFHPDRQIDIERTHNGNRAGDNGIHLMGRSIASLCSGQGAQYAGMLSRSRRASVRESIPVA